MPSSLKLLAQLTGMITFCTALTFLAAKKQLQHRTLKKTSVYANFKRESILRHYFFLGKKEIDGTITIAFI